MKAGFFETDITPPLGADRPACGSKLKLENFSDPLKIRALVLESDDGTKAALVGIDNISTGEKFRRKLDELLPGISLIVSASHTHYGGNLRDDFPGIETAPPEIRNIVIDQSVYYDKSYYEYSMRQFVTAVKEAEKRLVEAEFSFGKGRVENLIFNRRIQMKNGDCMTHPGKGNPDNVGYAGPVDDQLGVLGVWKKGTDEMLGFVLNFSCHACINLTGITSDFPGVAIETVRKVYGENVGAVYINGASGDVTQIDNMSLRKDTGKPVAVKLGRAVGGEAVRLLAVADRGEVRTLRAIVQKVPVDRRIPDPEFLPMAYEMVKHYDPSQNSHHIAKTYVMTDISAKEDPNPLVTVQTLQLGPLVIGSTPGEIFSQYALDYKKESPFPFTWYSQLSSRLLGYVPTPDCFQLANGGYEAETAFFASDTGTRLLKELLRQRALLTPEKAPEGEKVQPSNAVWGYNFNKKKS
ncbi:MAG: hypothetical protein J6A21_00890 [Lentisphaeria bacterium]|nr:hypothetical protein [Lentisphaeria bacterium]